MKRRLALIASIVGLAATAIADSPPAPDMESYWMVLLMRGARAKEYSPAELEQLQAAHLAHMDGLAKEGKIIAAGPFETEKFDETRGICFYDPSLDRETVEKLANADPMVKAGRLRVEVRKWWTQKGYVVFPHRQ